MKEYGHSLHEVTRRNTVTVHYSWLLIFTYIGCGRGGDSMNSTAFLTSMTTDDIMTTVVASGDLLLLLNDEQRKRNLVVVAVLAVVVVVGVVGNGLVLVVYNPRWSGDRLSPATIFILVMATLDVGSCLLSVPYEMADLLLPYDNDNIPLCRVLRSVTTLMSEARGMLLLCVACDRYLRICAPLVSYTPTQAKVVVAIVIVLSMVLAWPQAVLNGHITIATHKDGVLGTDCGILPTVPARYSLFYHTVITFIFAVCFTAYALLYSRIFYVLWRKGLFSSDRLSNRTKKSSKPATSHHRQGEGCQVNEQMKICRGTFTARFEAEGIDSRHDSLTCYGGCRKHPVSSTPDPDNRNSKSKERMDLASPTHKLSGSVSERAPVSTRLTDNSGDNSDTLNPRLFVGQRLPQKDVCYDSAASEELRLNPDPDAETTYAMYQRCFAVGDDAGENCEALVRDHVTSEYAHRQGIENGNSFGMKINPMHFARCDVVDNQGREEAAYNLDDSQRDCQTCGSDRGAKSCADINKPSPKPTRGLHRQTEILVLEQNASSWSARAEVEHAPLDSELIHVNILECSPFSDRVRTFHRYSPMQESQRQASILNNNTSGDKSSQNNPSSCPSRMIVKTTTAQPTASNNDGPQALARDSTSGNGIRRHGGRRLCLSKTTLMLATVTLATVLGYVPYLTVIILRTAGIRFVRDTSSTGDVVYMFCVRSFFLSNFINPVVYYFVNCRFKMKLHAALRRVCCCCCSSSPIKQDRLQPDVAASKLNVFAVIPRIALPEASALDDVDNDVSTEN